MDLFFDIDDDSTEDDRYEDDLESRERERRNGFAHFQASAAHQTRIITSQNVSRLKWLRTWKPSIAYLRRSST